MDFNILALFPYFFSVFILGTENTYKLASLLLCVDHRFVRPTAMNEQRITEYIEGKYGKFGVDRYVQHFHSYVVLFSLIYMI